MKLREIAHSRTGDKGNVSNISLIAYRPEEYQKIQRIVTSDAVQKHFAHIIQGKVVRYELPQLHALNFVLYSALGGGVTASTRLDKHGKSLSSYLLEMEI